MHAHRLALLIAGIAAARWPWLTDKHRARSHRPPTWASRACRASRSATARSIRGRRAARVILAPPNTVGARRRTRRRARRRVETDLLRAGRTPCRRVNAVVLSGGSAFGLDARGGVDEVSRGAENRLRRSAARSCRSCRRDPFRSASRRQPESAAGRDVRLRGRGARDVGPRSRKDRSAPAPARRSASSAARAAR